MVWTPAPQFPARLSPHAIHVYCAWLKADQPYEFWSLLSAEEQTRAARFRFAIDSTRFIVRRATLRRLLSGYLNIAPQHIRFAYTPHDKPYICEYPLHFNLSDAEDLALFAFAPVPVGVDLEYVHAMPDMDDVAALMFAPAESAVYRALPDEQKSEGFFNCWTRKEAFIKAVGEGMSYSLSDFEVTLKPDDTPQVLCIRGDTQAGAGWSLIDLQPAMGFRGALAVEGRGWQVNCYSMVSDG
jgi:4'-phosphopantetheinyl transferase